MARANSLVGDADAQKRNVIRINEAETLRMDDVGDGDVDEQKRMREFRGQAPMALAVSCGKLADLRS